VTIAIVGSRDFSNPDLVRVFIKKLAEKDPSTIILSGGARGVDTWAVETAQSVGLKTEVILADWEKHGKAAGMIRNTTLVERADKIVAFWDEGSKGTLDTILKAKKMGKIVIVINSLGSEITSFG
jgi:uncharacterized phage-like protein YoqJ